MRPHRLAPAVLLVLLLGVALAACAGGEPADRETEPADEQTEQPGQETETADEEEPDEEEPDEEASPDDATVPESAGVVLSRDGLGVVVFGAPAEPALQTLRDAMGKPNSVTRWLSMDRSLWGTCPGDLVRGAKWGDLWVIFSDESELSDERHVSSWMLGRVGVYGRTQLRTAEGIGVGSTVAELRAAYGERLSLQAHELGADFTVAPAPDGDAGGRVLKGTASGDQDHHRVRTMQGGIPCE